MYRARVAAQPRVRANQMHGKRPLPLSAKGAGYETTGRPDSLFATRHGGGNLSSQSTRTRLLALGPVGTWHIPGNMIEQGSS